MILFELLCWCYSIGTLLSIIWHCFTVSDFSELLSTLLLSKFIKANCFRLDPDCTLLLIFTRVFSSLGMMFSELISWGVRITIWVSIRLVSVGLAMSSWMMFRLDCLGLRWNSSLSVVLKIYWLRKVCLKSSCPCVIGEIRASVSVCRKFTDVALALTIGGFVLGCMRYPTIWSRSSMEFDFDVFV